MSHIFENLFMQSESWEFYIAYNVHMSERVCLIYSFSWLKIRGVSLNLVFISAVSFSPWHISITLSLISPVSFTFTHQSKAQTHVWWCLPTDSMYWSSMITAYKANTVTTIWSVLLRQCSKYLAPSQFYQWIHTFDILVNIANGLYNTIWFPYCPNKVSQYESCWNSCKLLYW